MPNQYLTRMTYVERKAIPIAAGGSTSTLILNANDLYDPDYDTGGNQCVGFDQLAAIYGFYAVSACRVRIVASSGMSVPVKCFIFPTIDPTSSSINQYTYEQMPGCKSFIIGGNSADGYARCQNYAKTKRVMPNLAPNEYGVTTTVNTSPTYRWYWILGMASMDTTSSTTINLEIKLDFYTRFSGRLILGES